MWEKSGDVLAEKKITLYVFMNSNTIRPEKFDHFHLVYHLTIPLINKKLVFAEHFIEPIYVSMNISYLEPTAFLIL